MATGTMRWRGTGGPIGSLSQRFPAMPGLRAEDVRSGNVRVIATSPSGRTQLMDVSDTEGMLNTNFTPDEVGDWTVSVLYDNQHIDGSPFHVRVYDPGRVTVFGLDGTLASRNYTFMVAVTGAGEGSLTIDITHNGQIIPAQITPDPHRNGEYNVQFIPQGSGYYTIRIFFAEVEVAGSPYTIEIVDASAVSATGPGLSAGQVQHRATFTINTGNAGGSSNDCRVSITDQRGVQVPTNVMDQHDGSLRVEFVPLIVGDHKIEIFYYGKPINGNPFICKVSDWSQVTVTNLPGSGRVGRLVEFDINATQAGPGDLEIMINGGTVPCTVVPRGNKIFHASFTPQLPQPHDIQVRFNNKEVDGSPWRINIVAASHVTVVGPGLNLIPVNELTWFELRGATSGDVKDIVVNIISPSHRIVRSNVTYIQNGVFRVEYTPTEAGNHSIEVQYECSAVSGSPFTSRAYDVSAITCSSIPLAFVDKLAEFTVDVSRAGEGQLEISINRGSVPNAARSISKGVYAVSFTPKEAKIHNIEVTFNGESCKCCCLAVPVIDISKVFIQGGCRLVPVGRLTTVRIDTQSAGEAELQARITSPSGTSVTNRVTGNSSRGFEVEFTPTDSGEYKLEVSYAGLSVPGGSVVITAYDINRIKVYDVQDGILNQETSFRVDTSGAGHGNVEVNIGAPSGAPVTNYIRPFSTGNFGVFYTPVQSGIHLINVTFNGEVVPGCPYRANVIDPSRASARGDGLDLVPCGQPASFFVSAPSAQLRDFDIKIIGPNSRDVVSRITDSGTNNFKVEYTPISPGDYRIEATYLSQPISGSPFIAKAWDINKVSVTNIVSGRVGQQSSFNINVRDAGEGTLEIGICGPSGQNVSNSVTALGPGHFVVTYIPLESGPHRANVTFNGDSVNGNPFTFMVNDPSRAVARGEGLGLVKCGLATAFTITAQGAQLKDIDVRIKAPNNRDIVPRLSDAGANNFKATYTPTTAGDYMIEISCFDQPITGSPFFSHASDISKVMVSNIATGAVGQQASFTIDVKNAGDGTLEISICGPSGQNVSNNVSPQSPGLFLVSFVPVESGQHRANVTFNKENVRGSPFQFMVIDPAKASARGDGLGLVRCGQPTSFVITAPAAQLTDLDVIITGPGTKQVVPRVSENGLNTFRVDYTPTVAGDHQIEVNYFDQPIYGSPFVAKVWDPTKVIVSPINLGVVGMPSTFMIELREAGEGTLEISINGPSGQNIPNNVVPLGPAQFEVSYAPVESGQHRANITFNKENVLGSPYQFLVIDSNRVTVRGDGLGLVKAGQLASFQLLAPPAQLKDIEVTITGPGNKAIFPAILEQGSFNFKVDYTPPVAGDYRVDITYFNQPIPNSPFVVKAWDSSKVIVTDVSASHVGCQTTFRVDARDAGDGAMEISISGPSGRNVQNGISQLGPGQFEVFFVPLECGQHHVSVTFNKDNVPGSRFPFMVTDPSGTGARGDGLGVIRCNHPALFHVLAPGAQLNNISVQITGPDNKDVAARVTETSTSGDFLVEYLPIAVGQYNIALSYFGQPINSSPYTAKAWCISAVSVTGLKAACIGKQSTFNVNVSQAGEGTMDVLITTGGEVVLHTAKNLGNGSWDVLFTPVRADIHLVVVKFNGEIVPGSPFNVTVIDGSRATASGDGLGSCIIANKPTSFAVNTKSVYGDAQLDICITSPRGQPLIPKITGSSVSGFNVEYTPLEAGRYVVDIKYAEMPISASPFYPEVFDPCQVRVGRLPVGFIGKPVVFDVDACMAGDGRLAVDVRGQITRPVADVSSKAPGIYTVCFVPQESVEHSVSVTFNSIPVPGSPFCGTVIDVGDLCAKWDCIRLRPVHVPVIVELDSKQTPDADVTCTVTDPQGVNIVTKLSKVGRIYKAEFTGHSVGEHRIDLRYGGVPVPGSPFVCNLYDVKRIRISDVTSTANVGQPATFTVDVTGAGLGSDLDVQVVSNDVRIPVQVQSMSIYRHRYTFVPMSPFNHVVSVKCNDLDVPGSPLIIRVINPAGQMALGYAAGSATILPIGQLVSAIITTHGIAVNPADINVKIIAPTRELLVYRLIALHDNDLKIEFTSRIPGIHCIEAQYAGQIIQGSPLEAEFFDPSKILIEGTTCGTIGETLVLDVMTTGAGKGELAALIKSSRGETLPFEIRPSANGFQIKYTPKDSGTHMINISYGGVDVPGCPIQQHIEDGFLPTASGDGLVRAIENKSTSFTVNSNGRSGDLSVTVEGPNSIARCNIEQEFGGVYRVSYIPVEVGVYCITILWNGKPIPGCPFKPKVCNPDKLMVVGGWQGFLLLDNKMKLELGQLKRIEFDSSLAGPGELGVEVIGPNGANVSVDTVSRGQDTYLTSFLPLSPGDYVMKVFWCGQLLQRCPIVGTVAEPQKPIEPQPCPLPPSDPMCDPCGVVLSGAGLTNARVREEAEFIVDGSNAGPGQPVVKLLGLKSDVDVQVVSIAPDRYKCVYVPELPGAYLLSISWGLCQVFGSPFKVTVASGSDPSKVNLSGAGLSGGICGQELEFTVNIKRAGSGELSATCKGPSKSAFCKLLDQQNGTFLLKVTPQEVGQHQLRVTFNGEQIPGSPFSFLVQTEADASKVKVSGSGIQSGILATFQSTFLVETRGAGAGRLTVRVRGPKGAFRVEMSKDPNQDRAIVCRYNPTEVGQYIVHVKWSDVHVPGSPFPITIVDTIQELENLRDRSSLTYGNTINGMMTLGKYDEPIYGVNGYGGGNIINGVGGGRFISDGMSTISSNGLVFGEEN